MPAQFLTTFAAEDLPFWKRDEHWPPSAKEFSLSLQMWAICQNRNVVTVIEAAYAFNTGPELIEEAVDRHPHMSLDDGMIRHDVV